MKFCDGDLDYIYIHILLHWYGDLVQHRTLGRLSQIALHLPIGDYNMIHAIKNNSCKS